MQAIAQTEAESQAKPNGGITKFKSTCAFLKNGTCSRMMMTVLNRGFGHPQLAEERATDPLAGGLMRGYQCGMLWGSTLAAGAEAYERFGAGPRAEAAAMRATQELVASFKASNGCVNCHEITETDPRDSWKVFVYFFLKGGTIGCIRRANAFASEAYGVIDAALSESGAQGEAPGAEQGACQSASCAAMLARKMGATEQQATMAAGLAGGIGQSGGGCGALGAAIWLLGIKGREAGLKTKVINAQIDELVERFLKSADHELECSEIVGRTFKGIDDHAGYVRGGGCAELIDALVAAAGALVGTEAEAEPESEYVGGASAAG
jgi:Putative redox-active protein (C_GCAxxG_C_C)